MAALDIYRGQIVLSKAGRDKDRFFLVVDVDSSQGIVYLADGDLRKIEFPKRKNIKHVQPTTCVPSDLADELGCSQKLSNKKLRQSLREKGYCTSAKSY